MAEVAFTFHWSPDVLWSLEFDELVAWHREAVRLNKQANGS
jgi:hypothetical protein